MSSAFEHAVLEGIELLRALPRERAQADAARQRFSHFRRAHPDVQAELVADGSGGPARADYDLLIADGQRGTLALSLARDDGSPWNLEHAEHWAAQRVLTLDGEALTLHDALRLLQAHAARGPSRLDELLDEALVARVLAQDEEPIELADVQRAADALRRRLRLHQQSHTLEWLERHGLSLARFEELARHEARRERWLDRLLAADGPAHFERHRSDFERIDLFLVQAAPNVLEELRASALAGRPLLELAGERLRSGSDGPLEGRLERRFAWELPGLLRAAAAGEVVGPYEQDGGTWLAQVLARSASELDARVRASLRTALFERWRDHARASTDVRWHWL